MGDRLQFLPRYVGIAAAARLFALLAIGLPSALLGDPEALEGVLLLGVVWTGAITLSVLARLPVLPALVLEAGLVTFVVAANLDQTQMLHLTALAVSPFIAGLRRGPRGVVEVLAAEVVVLALAAVTLHGELDTVRGAEIFTAMVMGLGVGLVSSFLRAVQEDPDDQLTPYRDARALITRLLDLSDDLGQGLDPVTIAERIARQVREALPTEAVVVYVERYGEFVPLLDSPAAGGIGARRALVDRARATAHSVAEAGQVAVPLATDAGITGVVVGKLTVPPDGTVVEGPALAEALHRLERQLTSEALRLDTAQLFSRVREAATSEERQRLAREVHDGIAQGVASLGYLVDALAADAEDAAQRDGLQLLRSSITDVVSEIRRSVFNLRNEATAGQRIVDRIQAVADNLASTSGMHILVEVEETGDRLLAEVEANLVRIAQEAMNNAVKHSGATVIRVELQTKAPTAVLRVVDDGVGMQPGRADSHGLKIMKERARRIGGEVEVETSPAGGVAVVVRVHGGISRVNGSKGLVRS
ncbi:sensor histidine kinase [Nocardioides perillae]|uniref:Signal transduction histidine kinase n=1 Tax=Nocardioides perillae TaxID=1119534 RepID=A0A7Y9ULB9_9ACTN|nr:ATP-binding protein [Nocardioides perillae]NYG56293.1 signal transduction histidine kinase [Nocardioides perillae]